MSRWRDAVFGLVLVLVTGSIVTPAPAAFADSLVTVDIKVKEVTDAQGPIYISLFQSAEDWSSEVANQILVMPVTVGSSKLQVNLPAGEYGFFLYQDLNGDGQLQRSGLGFPAEPYAFSNDVQIHLSKPSWDDIKFVVPKAGASVVVHINHP